MKAAAILFVAFAALVVIGWLKAFAGQPEPVQVATFLCDDADAAMAFQDRRDNGDEDEEAADFVGKQRGKQVCGRFVGEAVPESERVTSPHGQVYRLTAFRFLSDGRVAWLAESAPGPVPRAVSDDL